MVLRGLDENLLLWVWFTLTTCGLTCGSASPLSSHVSVAARCQKRSCVFECRVFSDSASLRQMSNVMLHRKRNLLVSPCCTGSWQRLSHKLCPLIEARTLVFRCQSLHGKCDFRHGSCGDLLGWQTHESIRIICFAFLFPPSHERTPKRRTSSPITCASKTPTTLRDTPSC